MRVTILLVTTPGSTAEGDDSPPLGLQYAARDGAGLQAVFLPAPRGEKIVAVVEPGHDPGLQWKRLRSLLDEEGVISGSPDNTHP